ncbi:iron dicitrate transport regulator FecR [[Clostridium] innocuum]|nr:iron dicitrate transport regulator FecR [[Clostridium] innocuum]
MENKKTTAKKQEHTALLRAILDEPSLIRNLLKQKKELTADFVQHFLTHPVKKVYFSGQASGTFIAYMLAPCMEKLLQVETTVCNPAAFPHYFQFNNNHVYKAKEQLLLCPAHSGTTIGPIRMAQECRKLGIPVICTTTDTASPLARLSDISINKLCGFEESFIETRTHMASLLILFLCIIETAREKQTISEAKYTYYQDFFSRLADSIEQIIRDTADWYKNHRELLLRADTARYIAAGPYYAAAQEGGLKIAEAASISSLVYEQEEFMHTGTTQIHKDTLFFLLAPKDVKEQRMLKLIHWCRMYSDRVILVGDQTHPLRDTKALLCSFINDEYLSVMEYIVPFQLLAHLIATEWGYSVVHAANDGASAYLKTHTEEV